MTSLTSRTDGSDIAAPRPADATNDLTPGAQERAAGPTRPPVREIEGARRDMLLIADHASRYIPAEYAKLGLGDYDLARHVAYDVGTERLTELLAKRLGAPAVLSQFSRLLIDPNRGLDDPTLVMRLSDGAIVPGNAHVDAAERARRIANHYRPYDEAVGRRIDALAKGQGPALFSIHSFTPAWKGVPRPWDVGVMWDADDRLARALVSALRVTGDVSVGANEPYNGRMEGSTIDRHAGPRRLPVIGLEVRNDHLRSEADIVAWADRLAPAFEAATHEVLSSETAS